MGYPFSGAGTHSNSHPNTGRITPDMTDITEKNATSCCGAGSATVWFEIPSTDFDRAVGFYETVMGATLRREKMGDGPTMAIFPYAEGGVGGSVMEPSPHMLPSTDGVVIYLNAGPDLAGPLSRVEGAGGRITMPKTLICEEIGYMAHFIDSEGNRMALHSRG